MGPTDVGECRDAPSVFARKPLWMRRSREAGRVNNAGPVSRVPAWALKGTAQRWMASAPQRSGTHLIPLKRSVPAAGPADTLLFVLAQSHGALVHIAVTVHMPSPAMTARGIELAESSKNGCSVPSDETEATWESGSGVRIEQWERHLPEPLTGGEERA